MADIYSLSEQQAANLDNMANKVPTFVVALPVEGDDESQKAHLTKAVEEAHDLEVLGLIRDVTTKFADKLAQLDLQRGCKVYVISDLGYDMFHESKLTRKRKTN